MPTIEDIEDVEDIDDLDMDLAEFDPDLVTAVAPIDAPRTKPQPKKPAASTPSAADEILRQTRGAFAAEPASAAKNENEIPILNTDEMDDEDRARFQAMETIFPCYFDENRSVKQGRRAPLDKCVSNPLAKTVLDACKHIGLPAVLEPAKTHPQDFGNSGLVKVGIRDEGRLINARIHSKRELLLQIGEYLVEHPTTLKTVKEMPGPPELTQGTYEPMEVAKVKGFKMNTIVPLHSPLTMKNPQTASAYKLKVPSPDQIAPKKPKQKMMRIRA